MGVLMRTVLLATFFALTAAAQFTPGGGSGGGGTGCVPPSTGAILKGDGAGGCTTSGLAPSTVVTSAIEDTNVGGTITTNVLTLRWLSTLAAARMVNSGVFTGDATSTFPALTIGANAITLGKMATLAANSTICNNTGSVATPIACSVAQMQSLLGTNFTLVTPTIASFTNATHNHQAAAGGGTLAESALALTDITTNNASTSNHGFLLKLDNNSAHFMNGQGAWATPAGGGSGCTTSGSANGILIDNGAGGCTTSTVTIDPTAGLAGGISMPQGTLITPPTSSITIQAPTSVTAWGRTLQSTVGTTGILHETVSGTRQTETTSLIVNADITNSTIDLTAKVTGVLPNANTTAASANTASAIVARDGSGNFSAGTITAALTGNASTSTALASNPADCSSNLFANAIAANGDLTCAALTLAGAQFANQGTTTTVLHGNAAGNPSFGPIVAADITSATITGTQIASSVALAGSPTTTTQSADDNSTKIATTAYVDRMKSHALSFSIGDPTNSSALTTSSVSQTLTVPFACTISAYNLAFSPGDTGTITVKFWKVATGTAIPTISNVINTSGVGIASGTAIHSTTVSDFTTTAVAANDMIAMVVTAVATTKSITGVLQCDL